jgi:hypothetical protein
MRNAAEKPTAVMVNSIEKIMAILIFSLRERLSAESFSVNP